jgi:hypothetical protein
MSREAMLRRSLAYLLLPGGDQRAKTEAVMAKFEREGCFVRPGAAITPMFRVMDDEVMSPVQLIWFWRQAAQQYSPDVCEAILRCASELEGSLMGRWGGGNG